MVKSFKKKIAFKKIQDERLESTWRFWESRERPGESFGGETPLARCFGEKSEDFQLNSFPMATRLRENLRTSNPERVDFLCETAKGNQ